MQVMVENGPGAETSTTGESAKIAFDRLRLGYRHQDGKFWAKFQTEFQKSDVDARSINTSETVFDAEVAYLFHPALGVRVGAFVMPTTMDFHTPAAKIDIAKRGVDAFLALNRSLGVMAYGAWNGFGYSLAAAEAADRSRAVNGAGVAGEDHAYAARVTYDLGELHLDASLGMSENAGTTERLNYHVMSGGAAYRAGPWTFKGDYTLGMNVLGVKDTDQSVWWLHAGYKFAEKHEAVIRHYQIGSEVAGQEDLTLGNTYLGYNYILNANALIRVNYVVAGGDNDEWAAQGRGVGGDFEKDIFLAMLQFAF